MTAARKRGEGREKGKGGKEADETTIYGLCSEGKRGGALYSTHVPYFVVRSLESYLSGMAETFFVERGSFFRV